MSERLGDARPRVVDVLSGALGDDVARLRAHDPVVREGVDPEGVHQARVACRRLRSQMRTFRKCLRQKAVAPLAEELAWLGALLGEVRDLDVLIERLEEAGESIGLGDRADPVFRRLRIERQEAFSRLLLEMCSARYRRLGRKLDALAADAPFRGSVVLASAEETLVPLVARRWRAVEEGVAGLRQGARDDELHHVRILAKRARYAAEVAAPFTPAEVGKLARKLAKLQKALGELSDGARAVAWLEQAKHVPFPPGLLVPEAADPVIALEHLLAKQHESLAAVRTSWGESYERAREIAREIGWSPSRPGERRLTPPPAEPGRAGDGVMAVRLSLRSR